MAVRGVVAVPVFRNAVLVFGIVGCVSFASAFLASIANPGFVEQVAQDVIRYRVESTVREKIEAIDASFLTKKAEGFAKTYANDIALAKRQLVEQLPARLAMVIAEMRNLDCECRKKIETTIHEWFEWRILNASQAQEHLTSLIRAKYMDTATQLTREFRIFTGTNAVVFALLILVVLVKRQAGIHLLPVTMVLLTAASATAYLYLFNQNWLHTVVFSDYVGLAYIGYLGGAVALLSDIILNRGRVTTALLKGLLNAIGSAIPVVPC